MKTVSYQISSPDLQLTTMSTERETHLLFIFGGGGWLVLDRLIFFQIGELIWLPKGKSDQRISYRQGEKACG